MSITIVGLGPGPATLLTGEARNILETAEEVYTLTSEDRGAFTPSQHTRVHSFDHALYGEHVMQSVVEELLSVARSSSDVVYAVPGHPLVGNATVASLIERCMEESIDYRIVHGVSQIEIACTALGLDLVAESVQIFDAIAPKFAPGRSVLILGVGHAGVSGLREQLLKSYPADHQLSIVDVNKGQVTGSLSVGELDSLANSNSSICLYVPRLELTRNLRTLDGLHSIVSYLRGADGCPWDRAQTHTSLKPFLLEETYEALEALDEGDPAKMQEEFGDVLFEVLLQTQVAEDEGEFDLGDLAYGIASKLVRRHPHVFGDEAASTAREVEQRWDILKQAERGVERSALDGVPTVMPALAYSQALLSRAARAGFAWPGLDDVLKKLSEEVAELEASPSQAEKQEEFGDILINVVNAARYLEIDAEDALRMASHKFRRRFTQVERLSKERGQSLSEMDIAEKQALWQQAKEYLELSE